MAAKLHVSNLPPDATEQTIRELFARAGTVASVMLMKSLSTGQSKQVAFVEMGSQKETEAAIAALNGYTLGENQLAVRLARRSEVPVEYHNRSRPHHDLGR